jgi:hypothetical protein
MGAIISGLEHVTESSYHNKDCVRLFFFNDTNELTLFSVIRNQTDQRIAPSRFVPLVRAFVESSLLSWVALAAFAGSYLAMVSSESSLL